MKKQVFWIRNALSERMIAHFEFYSQREHRLSYIFGICLPPSMLNFKGRVGNFFFPIKCKISKLFDAALHYKEFFSEHGCDSDQILKYPNALPVRLTFFLSPMCLFLFA